MSFPKLTMRQVRKHPAVINNPQEVIEGLEVAVCYLDPSPKKIERLAQAAISLVPGGAYSEVPIVQRAKDAYAHTRRWGITVQEAGSIQWVNSNNMHHKYPYALLAVTKSMTELPVFLRDENPVDSVDEIAQKVQEMPSVSFFDPLKEQQRSDYASYIYLAQDGLSESTHGFGKFLVDLTKLQ